MRQFLQKIIESQALQDSAGVARGLYKVADGLLKNHNEVINTDLLLHQTKLTQTQIQQQKQQQNQGVNNQPLQQQNQKIYTKDANQEATAIMNADFEKQKTFAQKQQEEQLLKEQQKTKEQLDKDRLYRQEQLKIQEQLKAQEAQQSNLKQKQEVEQIKKNNDITEKPILKNDNIQLSAKQQNQEEGDEEEIVHNQQFSVGDEKAIPSNSVSRAWGFGTLGVQLAYGAAKELIRTSIGGKQKLGTGIKGLLLSEENASVLSQGLCKMRGAPLKLAQALSIQEDEVIPKHVRDAFEKARQSADIMPKKQLHKMLAQELGENWKDNFQSFEEMPFAAASIGQVHRGVLKDGTKVAVKVQYPGVKESIDSDLNNLRRLMIYTGVFPKQMFLDRLIDYSRKELHEECNYTLEAEKQIKMYNFLKDDEDFTIPRIIENLSTERIMVSELIEGDTIDYISENYPQELRDDIGRRLMKVTLKELFLFQTMQTDPNPSNYYFNRKTNKLNLIDFGGVHTYSLEFMDKYIDVIYSATIQDRQRVLDISRELGYLTGEENQTMKTTHVDSVITVGEPFATTGKYDFGSQTLTTRTYKLMPQMLKNRLCPPPQETYSIHRKLSGAFLLSMKMRSNYDCRSIFLPLYEEYKQKRQGITRTFL